MKYSAKEMYKNLSVRMPIKNYIYLIFFGAIVYIILEGTNDTVGTIIGIVLLILTLVMHISQVMYRKKANKKLKEAINGPEAQEVLMDYNNAEGPYIGSVRLGNKYLYSDGNGLIDYNDISRIYEEIQNTKIGLEDKRYLKLMMKTGGEIIIGKPLTNGRSDNETKLITTFVLSKNPEIKLNKSDNDLLNSMVLQKAVEEVQKKHSEDNK